MPRPPFMPTTADRRRVIAAAGAGMSHETIAGALGVSRNTLELRFAAELRESPCRQRMEMLDALYRATVKGNASAQKAFLAKPMSPDAVEFARNVGSKWRDR